MGDLLGATVVLISCSYHGQEFIRVGYFVHNDYEAEELRETPPETPDMSQPITRSIMAEEPRVTRFRINWVDGASESVPLENGEQDGVLGAQTGEMLAQDTDSMLEPLPTSAPFKDVHSMDESSNVEMEMAF